MSFLVLCWLMESETEMGNSGRTFLFIIYESFGHVTDSGRQFGKMSSDIKEHKQQRYLTESIHVKKCIPVKIHWYLLNTYGDQTVDMGTVRPRIMNISRDG